MSEVRHPPGVLGDIVQHTLDEDPRGPFSTRPDLPVRSFVEALATPGLSLIAEVKPRSPSAGSFPLDLPTVCTAYAAHASAVSVLVDERYFGGSYELLRQVREFVPCPVLAKGFFLREHQIEDAHAAGADAVLLMAALLPPARLATLLAHTRSLGLAALVEAHDDDELEEVLASTAAVVGVNSRDLATLSIDHDASHARLARVPRSRIRVAESGLTTRSQVDAVRDLADAVLIGSALVRDGHPADVIEALGLHRCA